MTLSYLALGPLSADPMVAEIEAVEAAGRLWIRLDGAWFVLVPASVSALLPPAAAAGADDTPALDLVGDHGIALRLFVLDAPKDVARTLLDSLAVLLLDRILPDLALPERILPDTVTNAQPSAADLDAALVGVTAMATAGLPPAADVADVAAAAAQVLNPLAIAALAALPQRDSLPSALPPPIAANHRDGYSLQDVVDADAAIFEAYLHDVVLT